MLLVVLRVIGPSWKWRSSKNKSRAGGERFQGNEGTSQLFHYRIFFGRRRAQCPLNNDALVITTPYQHFLCVASPHRLVLESNFKNSPSKVVLVERKAAQYEGLKAKLTQAVECYTRVAKIGILVL